MSEGISFGNLPPYRNAQGIQGRIYKSETVSNVFLDTRKTIINRIRAINEEYGENIRIFYS